MHLRTCFLSLPFPAFEEAKFLHPLDTGRSVIAIPDILLTALYHLAIDDQGLRQRGNLVVWPLFTTDMTLPGFKSSNHVLALQSLYLIQPPADFLLRHFPFLPGI